MNKRKIINDPVYGFISISNDFIFDLIQHRYFQRLRNILQLGLTNLVYPGASHTRFQHSLGAMHLMQETLEVLRYKDIIITKEEEEATLAAILLHDIGHGPFSHTLEHTLIESVSHETLTDLFLEALNREFKGKLSLAIQIYNDTYHKHFLHQLVSGQLDVDRLDYLTRDSFFTGVSEGVIGTERIIKMLNVVDNELVADIKALYSIEKFIISRRLMYWQVYLHKTVHAIETMLIQCLKRAKTLLIQGNDLFLPPSLRIFFEKDIKAEDFLSNEELLNAYADLDDRDIWYCLKMWRSHSDFVLSELSKRVYYRNLFKIEVMENEIETSYIQNIKAQTASFFNLSSEDVSYFVIHGKMENRAYNKALPPIRILDKNGNLHPLENLSDHLNHRTLSEIVNKYFICYPKHII
ncbi:MAG: HD domain-containing protein [Bacteroidales bacterium]|jgi:HD superfamily phosphohydrolase|nr:HD domain-containing protein [Bacteroidales bacterium]